MSDRDLAMRWVNAWAHVRALRLEQVDGWPLVHVGAASRETEIVCVDPGRSEFEKLAGRIAHHPREMLTVIGRDLSAYHAPPLPTGLRIDRDDERLMATTLVATAAPPPDGFTPRWVVDGTRATYTLDDGERVVAEGSVGVLGPDATFDRIETSPQHRRTGLGRHVMAALTTWAIDRGAASGVLVASADGAQLYTALGWDTRLLLWSLMGVDA